MKMLLALLVVAIGFVMVHADGHFGDDDRLEMALKTLLQGEEELNLESRDTKRTFDAKKENLEIEARDKLTRCQTDTKNCDGHGSCQQSTFGRTYGQYICFCDSGYRGNSYGGCTARTKREMEYLTMIARDQELEMQARDTLAQCKRDTKNCDGFGQCVKTEYGRGQFICSCNDGYENNLNGGCSLAKHGQYICFCDSGYRGNSYGGCTARTKRDMEYLTMIARDQELEMQARDTLAQCKRDTKNCDGFGQCVKTEYGRGQFICSCNDGYENNLNGGCSPKITRDFEFNIADPVEDQSQEEEENDNMDREFKLDLLRRLANILQE